MRREFDQVAQRIANPSDSYTSELLKDDSKLTRKLVEEALELGLAFRGVEGSIIPEFADVVYSGTLLVVKRGYTVEDLAKEMRGRQK
jgi:phosphoribosyl-ATP pyrophosphohydrolase